MNIEINTPVIPTAIILTIIVVGVYLLFRYSKKTSYENGKWYSHITRVEVPNLDSLIKAGKVKIGDIIEILFVAPFFEGDYGGLGKSQAIIFKNKRTGKIFLSNETFEYKPQLELKIGDIKYVQETIATQLAGEGPLAWRHLLLANENHPVGLPKYKKGWGTDPYVKRVGV
ncbi:MAG TPA: hypothetical protein PK720_00585 [bacterium]|nr:hypothetical protein [bacterium]